MKFTSLRDYLQKTGSTQRQLAHDAGMSEQQLSNLLTGSRGCSIRMAIRLSSVTGVPVENLVRWKKIRPQRTQKAVA